MLTKLTIVPGMIHCQSHNGPGGDRDYWKPPLSCTIVRRDFIPASIHQRWPLWGNYYVDEKKLGVCLGKIKEGIVINIHLLSGQPEQEIHTCIHVYIYTGKFV